MNEYAQAIKDGWEHPLATTWDEEQVIEAKVMQGKSVADRVDIRSRQFSLRDELVGKYSWAIPTDEAISVIADFGSVVEWCAGLGYWSHLVSQKGARVEAFTEIPGKQVFHVDNGPPWFDVQETVGDEAAISEAMNASTAFCLMLVWPPYDLPVASHCLKHFKGGVVAYVGEWQGCTADDEFHDMLDADWIERAVIPIPRWQGVRDSLYIMVRK